MDESSKKPINSIYSRKVDRLPTKKLSRIAIHRPSSVVQRIKPKKRDVVSNANELNMKEQNNENAKLKNQENKSNLVNREEFDGDENENDYNDIENENDWYKELDTVAMPHLLGLSATKHSPVPVEYQHLPSIPLTTNNPFGCQQLLIQWIDSKPIITTVSCPMQYQPYHYSPHPYHYSPHPYHDSSYYNYNPNYYDSPYYQY